LELTVYRMKRLYSIGANVGYVCSRLWRSTKIQKKRGGCKRIPPASVIGRMVALRTSLSYEITSMDAPVFILAR